MSTLYDVLGVAPDVSAPELRQAYVSLARSLHPDRPHGDARRMREVNEAWRVLRDPARRHAYDEQLRAAAAPPVPPPSVDPMDIPFDAPLAEPGDVGVAIARALPWVAILVVLAAIFLVTAVANRSSGPTEDDLVDRCVAFGRASKVSAVPCSQEHDGKVVLVVDHASYCPDGSEGRALDDDRWLCLEAVP